MRDREGVGETKLNTNPVSQTGPRPPKHLSSSRHEVGKIMSLSFQYPFLDHSRGPPGQTPPEGQARQLKGSPLSASAIGEAKYPSTGHLSVTYISSCENEHDRVPLTYCIWGEGSNENKRKQVKVRSLTLEDCVQDHS